MDFRLLGPMEITIAGERVRIGRRQERELLAVLLLHAGRWVAVDRITDLLWGAAPPVRARETVVTYVSRLRQVLGAAGATGLLERRGDAYRLGVDPLTVDCHRFEEAARRAAGVADPAERVGVYRSALRLWTGPALTDAPALTSLAEALEQRHREVRRQSFAAYLDAGQGAEVLGELAELAAADPLDEDATTLLMRALAEAGRRSEALAAFGRLRVRLNEDLGLDPGTAVSELYARILRDETPAPVPAGAARTAPAQLPPEPRFFAARRRDLEALVDLMKRPEPPAVLTIAGLAGVGKTTLAVSLAHRLAGGYPDGQLYLDLRGFSPTGLVGPEDALYALLIGLGVAPADMPSGLDARTGLYRSRLAGRRVLVLLDNARGADQVRPLLPPGDASAALITSRNRMSGLAVSHNAHPVELSLLAAESARQMLAAYVGPFRMAAEPDAVTVVLDRCAGLPLALAVVGAQAVTRPGHRLADIVRELGPSVSHVEDEATDPRNVFSWSYDQLSAAAARIFRRMSVVFDGELSAPAARSLAYASPDEVSRAMAELVNAGLLTERGPDRFGAHDLLMAYAAERAADTEGPGELDAARLRLYDHYYETAWAARLLIYPDEPVAHEPLESAVRAPLADAADARRWLDVEHENLVQAVMDLADRGRNATAMGLGRAIIFFLGRSGHWHDWLKVAERLLPVVELLDDDAERGWLHRSLGYAYLQFGRADEAETHFHRGIACLRRTGNRRVLGNAMNGLAHVHFHRGDYAATCTAAAAARDVFLEIGLMEWAAGSVNAIAWAEVHLDELDAAIGHCREALDMLAAAGFSESSHAAATWDTYGAALRRQGDLGSAGDAYRRAAGIFDDIAEPARAASTLRYLGDCELDAGARTAAAETYRQALARCATIDVTLADELRAKLGPLTEPL